MKPKTFLIVGRAEAEAVDPLVPYIYISIRDIGSDRPRLPKNPYFRGGIRLQFDDVQYSTFQYKTITPRQARAIADFVKKNIRKADLVLVHCEAGISRSAAVAAAIMRYYWGDDRPVFRHPRYNPNMTVYRAVLKALRAKSRS